MKSQAANRIAEGLESRDVSFVIRNELEFVLALRHLSALVGEVGDNLQDPRYRLIETLSTMIDAYDASLA
jgi:hypothetical protein